MKNLVILIGSILLSTVVFAKSPITVKLHEGSDNADVSSLLNLLDANMTTATICADSIDAKYYAVWMVHQKENESLRTLLGYTAINPDSASTPIRITTMAKDSLNVLVCLGPNRKMVNIPTTGYTLVGCDFEWTFNETDTIPLMAYTTGIPMKKKVGDKVYSGYYICGVRYSKVHPSEWKEKYNLPDYIYFEAIPIKEFYN